MLTKEPWPSIIYCTIPSMGVSALDAAALDVSIYLSGNGRRGLAILYKSAPSGRARDALWVPLGYRAVARFIHIDMVHIYLDWRNKL